MLLAMDTRLLPLLLAALAAGSAACGTTPTSLDATVDAQEASADAGDLDAAAQDSSREGSAPRDAMQCPAPLGTARARGPVGALGYPMDAVLRMNHVQHKGTHNSYHLRPDPYGPDWDYSHATLDVQLDRQGVRQVEIDVHYNAACGRYEVYHLGLIDPLSTCHLFTDCLTVLRAWSDAHPGHLPLYLHVEPKDSLTRDQVEPRMAALEQELLSVWPRELLITPDEVQGTAATLDEAVRTRGWPTLGAVRGRMLAYLDNSDTLRDVYSRGQTSLRNRLFFIDSDVGTPIASMVLLNNPTGANVALIQSAVRAGYIVRTFAEQSDDAAHANDRSYLDAALSDGAHILSTDFPAPVNMPGGAYYYPTQTYFVDIPGGTPARCNPLVAPMGCTSDALESPSRLTPR